MYSTEKLKEEQALRERNFLEGMESILPTMVPDSLVLGVVQGGTGYIGACNFTVWDDEEYFSIHKGKAEQVGDFWVVYKEKKQVHFEELGDGCNSYIVYVEIYTGMDEKKFGEMGIEVTRTQVPA